MINILPRVLQVCRPKLRPIREVLLEVPTRKRGGSDALFRVLFDLFRLFPSLSFLSLLSRDGLIVVALDSGSTKFTVSRGSESISVAAMR